MKVVTRIAPSPTGYLHFGLARTALYSYLYARKHGGEFIVRIEDTDQARNKPEFEEDINDQLRWLGLVPDRAYRQSEHVERHTECLRTLIESDKAYVSSEPAKDDPSRIVEVVRLRNPGEKITFEDGIRGPITFDTAELKDFVIARSVSDPLYHLAVVIDDHDESVTHVIRGDDHISNTPRQILILKALGFEIPLYTHLPLILMPDKSKMSKRKHETAVRHYRDMGILPEALLNYIAHLGWTAPSQKEILRLDEMIAEFDLKDLHKSGAVFDIEKLRWYNREYLQKLTDTEFAEQAQPRLVEAMKKRGAAIEVGTFTRLLPILRERMSVWNDIDVMAEEGEFDFYINDPVLESGKIPDRKSTPADAALHLGNIHEALSALNDDSFADPEKVKESLWEYATTHGRGAVLWPLRYALSGRDRSPDPFFIASMIGKGASLRRIQAAQKILTV